MARVRIKFIIEYDMYAENYPDNISVEEMMEIDRQNAIDDPYSFMDMGNLSVEAELV